MRSKTLLRQSLLSDFSSMVFLSNFAKMSSVSKCLALKLPTSQKGVAKVEKWPI